MFFEGCLERPSLHKFIKQHRGVDDHEIHFHLNEENNKFLTYLCYMSNYKCYSSFKLWFIYLKRNGFGTQSIFSLLIISTWPTFIKFMVQLWHFLRNVFLSLYSSFLYLLIYEILPIYMDDSQSLP